MFTDQSVYIYLLCTILTLSCIQNHATQINVAKKKPNIILILADDVGTGDIPGYWNTSLVDMPNIDRLAKMGVTFKDAHSTPMCAPSRYMILSGNYAHRGHGINGAWNLVENQNQFMHDQKSIAATLRDEGGYHTSMFGKWHLGGKAPGKTVTFDENKAGTLLSDPDINWTNPLIQGPQDIGFDSSYITIGGIQSPPYSFFRDGYLTTNTSEVVYWDKDSEHSMPHGTSIITRGGEGDANWDSSAYNMILVNETTRFIDNHLAQNKSQPFFTYVALGSVHSPHSPPNQYIDGSPVKNEYPTGHLDLLLEMDKVVGSIVSLVEDRNISNDTIIIFTSDNGGLGRPQDVDGHRTSGPLRGKKNMIYEGGHRVPLIIRYDHQFPTSAKRNKLIGLNDLYATICDIVGVQVPVGSAQDSISFAEYISSAEKTTGMRKKLATWTYGSYESPKAKNKEAIRFGRFKLVHNIDASTFELYNLKKDLSEKFNLGKIPTYKAKMYTMYQHLKTLGPCPGSDDLTTSFRIDKEGGKKTCDWFRRNKTKERCEKFSQGRLYCPSICETNRDYYCSMKQSKAKLDHFFQ